MSLFITQNKKYRRQEGYAFECLTPKYQVADVIREVKPDIIITHWKGSIHKDHENTHYIVQDAHFYAALKTIERELPAHYARHLYYADNWEGRMTHYQG